MKRPPATSDWQGRIDSAEGPLGRRWHQAITPLAADSPVGAVALLGFCCDAGVARNGGRVGASDGPAALRAALKNMPLRRCDAMVDAGDVICSADALEETQDELATAVSGLLGRGLFPIVLGGGHEMAFGSFMGLAHHLEATATVPKIGIINLDAHFDLRLADRANSGTPFRQISEICAQRDWPFRYACLGVSEFSNTESLFERADQLGVVWRLDEDLSLAQLDECVAQVQEFISEVDHIYFTICLDVLPAATVPGVSAPSARGVALEVVEPLLDLIVASGKLRLADIAELNPRYDIDQRSARVAARLVARIANRITA